MKKRWANVESFVLRQCVQLWSGLDTCVYNYICGGLDTYVYNCAVVWIPVCTTMKGLDTCVYNCEGFGYLCVQLGRVWIPVCTTVKGLDTCEYNCEGFGYLCVKL